MRRWVINTLHSDSSPMDSTCGYWDWTLSNVSYTCEVAISLSKVTYVYIARGEKGANVLCFQEFTIKLILTLLLRTCNSLSSPKVSKGFRKLKFAKNQLSSSERAFNYSKLLFQIILLLSTISVRGSHFTG